MWEPVKSISSDLPEFASRDLPEFTYYHHSADPAEDDEAGSSSSTASSRGCPVASDTARLLAKLSNSDLAFEWSMLCQDCTDCWSQNGRICFIFN